MSNQKYFDTNKELWDQKVQYHLKSELYNFEAWKKGEEILEPIVLNGLGDVKGKSILHLQCHFGQDSLSLARLGAKVTGVDFSPNGIKMARDLATELKLDATFVEANVLELDQHLTGQFDIILTSYGTVTWLPDLNKWAENIRHFLKPGGTFFFADFHPFIYTFDWDSKQIEYNYFNNGVYSETSTGTYADPSAPIKHTEYFWCHSIQETLNPLLQQGLVLKELKEYPYSPWNCMPNMKSVGERKWVFGNFNASIPHVYSLKMQG